MIRSCIIGVSGYGRVHYDLLLAAQAAGKVGIAGATIINPTEETDKCTRLNELGCRVFDDYRVMLTELSGRAELCMIPTGTPLHRPMTLAALEAGMNVLVEKPAAGCIEDVRAMQIAAQKAGRTVAVGYQQMYAQSTMDTKRHILNGTIGKLESIKCLVMWPRDHSYYTRNSWAGRLTVGNAVVNDSPFNNAVAHELMMMLFQAGATEREAAIPVSVDAEIYRANAIESADTACMHITTEEGVPIRFYASHACKKTFEPEIHILGTKGEILMTHNRITISPRGGKPIGLTTGGGAGARHAMMDAVLDAVQGGSSFICDLELASRQTMVVGAIHRACPVRPVEGETCTSENGAQITIIPGIEDVLRQAFAEDRLLHEGDILLPGINQKEG